jgi:peptidyl-prolyl cis-trans isomerase B (cyclophilin B)
MRIKAAMLVAALVIAGALAGCSAPTTGEGVEGTGDKRTVEITVTDFGTITVELDAGAAPITVENFVKLVEEGFYDGLTFHRSSQGFVIQGGDNGTGGTDEIYGEFADNGWKNPISHERGVISMARSREYDSASCQFFITLNDSAAYSLDGRYAAFGHVTEGMDVVDAISALPTDGSEKLLETVVMESVRLVD